MKKILLACFAFILTQSINAQTNLIVNELSQGSGGSKEFIELLVVGERTCTDSTADIRNWIFDDHNGWYGGSGTGIAAGHYRFKNDPNWEKVPYGSIILIYNPADRNNKIPAGSDDATDANKDYVYILPVTNNLIEQNLITPESPSSPTYTYPTTGYNNSTDWVSLGLANSGDGVIIVNPATLGIAHFSIIFGFTPSGASQVPTVSLPAVTSGQNAYLDNDLYTIAANWIIGTAGTANETPGSGNSADNITWIESMRVQLSSFSITTTTVQPTCLQPQGSITVTSPVGVGITYSIDGTNFNATPDFTNLNPGSYTVTVKDATGCTATEVVVVNAAPGAPTAPVLNLIQPTCIVPQGTITITSPLGGDLTYSIDGINFQAPVTFGNLAPGSYTVTVLDASGCSSTSNTTINAVPAPPAAPAVSSPINYCIGETAVPLSALGTDLLWYTTEAGGTGSTTAPVPSTTAAGSALYYVSQNVGGCESERAEIEVIVTSPTLPAITGNTRICLKGNTESLLSNPVIGGTWNSSNTAVATVDNAGKVTAVGVGSTTITYSALVGTCSASITTELFVSDFILSLTANPNPVIANSNVALTTSASTPYEILSWLPLSSFVNQTSTSQNITVPQESVFSAIAQNADGCIDTAEIVVMVIPPDEEIYVPNAFTPNNDGINDIIRAYGNSIIALDMTIFNQWGEKITQISGITQGWDGKHRGKLQPTGVYVYVLKATMNSGKVIDRKGFFNLIR